MFSMECILSQRGDFMAPVAADTLLNAQNSEILSYPVRRLRAMVRQMNEDNGVQVYWSFCLITRGEMHVSFLPPHWGKDPLVDVLASLLLVPSPEMGAPAMQRFVNATFEERWKHCPWTPSREGFHSLPVE
jgi:hypothetical protein